MNFEKTTHGKIGDIIYPACNGTNGFMCRPRWDLVKEVDKNGLIIGTYYIWDWATVKAIQLIQKLYNLEERGLKRRK